jgi:SAM-dependent methyltransferase
VDESNRPSHLTDDSRTRRKKAIQRKAAHFVFGTRSWVERRVGEIAQDVRGKRILEIGSGRQDLGRDAFSARSLFHESNAFIQSDVAPEFGHELVDVRTMDFENEFDIILCLYVLEHVFELDAAVRGIHRALAPGGRAVIAVPHLYPYHDEPTDYWRFTEYAVRRLLEPFSSTEIAVRGFQRLPLALLAVATK